MEQKEHGMATRGVSRPMMKHDNDGESEQKNKESMEMTLEDREKMMHMHHVQTLWVYWMLILLGAWMIMAPLTFSYGKGIVMPSGGREVWLSLEARIMAMHWSDIISGLMLVFFGWRALKPNRPVSVWIICFIGIWISMAPLLFWSPSAAAYLNDTFVGMLVISLSVLIPGMPNMIMYMKMGSEVPPGWTYNPSSWAQRWIMIATGFLGFIVSRYLAAFQLGYIDTVWDPFFGNSTEQVLNSAMSHSLPISDAGLGTLAYTFEFLMGFMGSPSRWRTMPWMVTLFGILVIPLGLAHIILVISQPLTVGAWCTFCLLAAAIMLPMIPLEVDEVVAMGQHMKKAVKRGDKFWSVFWKGGKPFEMNKDERSPEIIELPSSFRKVLSASVWGMSAPWTLAVSAVFGALLMAAPGSLGVPIKAPLADVNHLCGSIIVVVSVISMGEVVRSLRFLNIAAGLALAIIPWLINDPVTLMKIISTIGGIVVILLSIPRGVVKEKFGTWDNWIV
ncbi:MAG TPA: vitamin K epoxide reductase family protein [Bacteroidales bacterium]|nr:vitamin K epoxide reductase family protein [Bacteroidales bacterium]